MFIECAMKKSMKSALKWDINILIEIMLKHNNVLVILLKAATLRWMIIKC
jgi:hypothetical protein